MVKKIEIIHVDSIPDVRRLDEERRRKRKERRRALLRSRKPKIITINPQYEAVKLEGLESGFSSPQNQEPPPPQRTQPKF